MTPVLPRKERERQTYRHNEGDVLVISLNVNIVYIVKSACKYLFREPLRLATPSKLRSRPKFEKRSREVNTGKLDYAVVISLCVEQDRKLTSSALQTNCQNLVMS